jgi:hypothetical protein
MSTSVNDWRKEKYQVLLEAGAHAVNRARYVFIALNVTGIFVLIGLFNSTFPWVRNSIARAKAMSPPPDHLLHIQKTMYEDLWTMTAPLIGVRISVFDLAIVGSVSLFVLAVWLYYCTRRENLIVLVIASEALAALRAGEKEAAAYLYHGIAHYFVFTTRQDISVPAGEKPRLAPTIVVQALLFMPAWIPCLIVLSDVFTVFVPFTLSFDPTDPLWNKISFAEKVEACIRILVALSLGAWSLALCRLSLRFDRATRESLEPLTQKLSLASSTADA